MKHNFEITEKLPIEFKKKWVEALRSGKYKQGKGALHRRNCFCCLGVVCMLFDISPTQLGEAGYIQNRDDKYTVDADVSMIPDLIKGDNIENEIVTFISNSNDSGSTFEEIADWIEINL